MFYGYSTVIPKTNTPSDSSHINIKNITGKGLKTAVEIRGLPEYPLNSISLENIQLSAETAIVCSDVKTIDIEKLDILATINPSTEFTNVTELKVKDFSVKYTGNPAEIGQKGSESI
jgi:hypothetical protein